MSRKDRESSGDPQKWLEVILKHLSGQITASDAAKHMGVSRKTYYKRENRMLAGALQALEDRPTGRPAKKVNAEEAQTLEKQVKGLEKELLLSEQKVGFHEMLLEDLDLIETVRKKGTKKK